MSSLQRAKAVTFTIGRLLVPILLIAVIVLWIRSFYYTEEVHLRLHTKSRVSLLYFASMPGSLGILFDCSQLSFPSSKLSVHYNRHRKNFGALYCVPENTSSPWNALGFAYNHESLGVTELIRFNAPHWFVAIVLAGGVFLAWRRRRRSPMESSPCPACGYSLIGNESGVCPECGTACNAAEPAGNRTKGRY